MRHLFGTLLVALNVAGASASAGEFVEIESGTRAEPVRLIGYMARPQAQDPSRPSCSCTAAGAFTVP